MLTMQSARWLICKSRVKITDFSFFFFNYLIFFKIQLNFINVIFAIFDYVILFCRLIIRIFNLLKICLLFFFASLTFEHMLTCLIKHRRPFAIEIANSIDWIQCWLDTKVVTDKRSLTCYIFCSGNSIFFLID